MLLPEEKERLAKVIENPEVKEPKKSETKESSEIMDVVEKMVLGEKPALEANKPADVENTVISENTAEHAKTEAEPAEHVQSESVAVAKYHTVKEGESLWSIVPQLRYFRIRARQAQQHAGQHYIRGDRFLISGNGVLIHEAEPAHPIAVNKVKTPEAERAEGGKKSEIVKTVVTQSERFPQQQPEKTDITADFNPKLATSAVSIRNTEVTEPRPVPQVRPPDKQCLYTLVNSYVSAYKNKDIDRVKALFAHDAKENGVGISRVISTYISNFSRLEIVRYDVKVNNVTLDNSSGYVKGNFFITFKDHRTGVLKNSRGNINWKLSWDEGEWKI
jgi:hypothetical protein